ncbi:Aminomethyltransferase folate-binding domain-containing protein [Tumidithrix helvetica PCC 7403]|uniref:hypothetical protein n=1 Tax=Tumidithrix helvetica TaxID=3457545 RepID=UPI003C9F4BBB
MALRTETPLGLGQVLISMANAEATFENYVLGAATFDLSGLPKEYFSLVGGSKSIIWVQPIFQAIGLKSLLATSLSLDTFNHVVIRGKDYTALVVRQNSCYLAILLEPTNDAIDEKLIDWARHLDTSHLKRNPRFQVI